MGLRGSAQSSGGVPERRAAPIAEAIAERFGELLHRPCVGVEQQWWTTNGGTWNHKLPPLFQDFERVYDAGQFTWAGLWTVGDPPDFAHAQLIDAWEMNPGPVTRWQLPVRPDAAVFEIHRQRDWVRLVEEHPRQAAVNGECWELPSRNQDVDGIKGLLGIPGQHAARGVARTHLVPDWRSVARQYDGVHLSWAGFITSEGYVSDLGGGDVAMLRYWFSERTHWLTDVFDEPEPLAAPSPPPDRFGEKTNPPPGQKRKLRGSDATGQSSTSSSIGPPSDRQSPADRHLASSNNTGEGPRAIRRLLRRLLSRALECADTS